MTCSLRCLGRWMCIRMGWGSWVRLRGTPPLSSGSRTETFFLSQSPVLSLLSLATAMMVLPPWDSQLSLGKACSSSLSARLPACRGSQETPLLALFTLCPRETK